MASKSAAPEKRAGSDDEATDGSESMPALVSDSDESRHLSNLESPDNSPPGSPSGSAHDSHQDWPPKSPAASFHEGDAPYMYFPQTSPIWWSYDTEDSASYQGSAPLSPSGSSHFGSASSSLSAPSNYDSAHESLSGSSDYDSAAESSAGSLTDSASTGSLHEGDRTNQFFTYPLTWWRFDQVSSPSQGSAPEVSSESDSSQYDSAAESSIGSMTHSGSVGSMPELVSDSEEEDLPEPMSDSSRNLAAPTTTHVDSAPESADQSTHHDSAPVTADPSSNLESVASTAWHEAESSVPEADKLFDDELKPKRRDYAVLGTVDDISTGPINGARKETRDTVSPREYVSALFFSSAKI